MAQEEGFEPPWLLTKRFSRPPRCDRFAIPAFIGRLLCEFFVSPAHIIETKQALIYIITFRGDCQQQKIFFLKSIDF